MKSLVLSIVMLATSMINGNEVYDITAVTEIIESVDDMDVICSELEGMTKELEEIDELIVEEDCYLSCGWHLEDDGILFIEGTYGMLEVTVLDSNENVVDSKLYTAW